MDKLQSNVITIVLADDHPLLREGLKFIIEKKGDLKVIGEAGNGEEVLELIEQLKPLIVIIDVDMPRLNGLEVAKEIQQKEIPVKVIVLTMYDKEKIFNRAMDLGVTGYVIKDSAVAEIVDAVRTVAASKYYISPAISGFLVRRSQPESVNENVTVLSSLTKTERKILKMIAGNKTSKEIADELSISIHTVNAHRANICQKLNLSGTNALLHFAVSHPDLL